MGVSIGGSRVTDQAHHAVGVVDLLARFWSKVDVRGKDECWAWLAGTNTFGYGYFHIRNGKKLVRAHRFAYELLVGPIPDDLQLDHLCRNTLCVNPAHLEAVTAQVNTRRSNSLTAQQARQTHCVHGHEFTAENTYRDPRGRRGCRTCGRVRQRVYDERRRRARAALAPDREATHGAECICRVCEATREVEAAYPDLAPDREAGEASE